MEVSLDESSNEDHEDVKMTQDELLLEMPPPRPSMYNSPIPGIDLFIEVIPLVLSSIY